MRRKKGGKKKKKGERERRVVDPYTFRWQSKEINIASYHDLNETLVYCVVLISSIILKTFWCHCQLAYKGILMLMMVFYRSDGPNSVWAKQGWGIERNTRPWVPYKLWPVNPSKSFNVIYIHIRLSIGDY